ncbi:MAG: hypothetical protein V1703_00805 [Candidatus Altiarchaeota archaeon]
MAGVLQAEKNPEVAVKEGIDILLTVESSKRIGGVRLPTKIRQHTNVLFGIRSRNLDYVRGFLKPLNVGLKTSMGTLGRMVGLI